MARDEGANRRRLSTVGSKGVSLRAQRPILEHGRPNGEAVLLRQLFEEYGPMVLVVCRALLRDRQEAEDAAQQTYLAAYQSLLTGTGPRHPAAWLATIARNECRARLRRAAAIDETAIEPAEPTSTDPVDLVGFRSMLAELPERQREVVALHCLVGLSYQEVASQLQVSRRAVDGLLSRARGRLRRRLRDSYELGGVLLPEVLRERLAQLVPGFEHGNSAAAAVPSLVSIPVAAKVAAAAAGVAVLGSAGASSTERLAVAKTGSAPTKAQRAPRPEPKAAASVPRSQPVGELRIVVTAPPKRRARQRSARKPHEAAQPDRVDSSGPGSRDDLVVEERNESSGPGSGEAPAETLVAAPAPRVDNSGPGSTGSGHSGSGTSGSDNSGSGRSGSDSSSSGSSGSSGSGSSGSGSGGSDSHEPEPPDDD